MNLTEKVRTSTQVPETDESQLDRCYRKPRRLSQLRFRCCAF